MNIDLLKYQNIMVTVANVAQSNSNKSHNEIISCIAVASHAPAIVAAYYYIKHLGHMPEEIKGQIQILKKFYNYDEINGVEEILNGIHLDG